MTGHDREMSRSPRDVQTGRDGTHPLGVSRMSRCVQGEPRCETCEHWIQHQPLGYCVRNRFETYGDDNCKHHTDCPK